MVVRACCRAVSQLIYTGQVYIGSNCPVGHYFIFLPLPPPKDISLVNCQVLQAGVRLWVLPGAYLLL
ncbi:hypothetical protein QA601_18105, partial [Chitinispirillales bacterium ANBcel5]|uniref:hypothetical protein n=1 Tax=Cellulosispirillum alkaliphilum TaxID=3039283 RepID=UPI002A55B655|nr:hypothetical protein [Chitinispirillales bacterium ANBcel5]